MIDLQDKGYCPVLEELGEFVKNPLFMKFCSHLKVKYKCKEKIEFSSCCWEPGWNVKFRKSGKSLCTIYPKEGFFTVLVVIGAREKVAVEAILPECTKEVREIYKKTKLGNGQKWLMIDLEDQGEVYEDIFRLIEIRKG